MMALRGLIWSAVLLLAACASPEGKRMDTSPGSLSEDAGMIMAEAPARTENPAPLCTDDGDGIGGTGCPVD